MLTRRGGTRGLLASLAVMLTLTVTPVLRGTGDEATPSSAGDEDTGTIAGPVTGSGLDAPGLRPNIVVIMTDDMRADELRWMPHVRELIGEAGVRFTNSFSPHPLCCPARASFLTGRYTHNHGVWSNSKKYGFRAFDDRRTLATALSGAGYDTLFVGKYLNGYGSVPAPDGSSSDSLAYVPPGWTDWRGAVGFPTGSEDHPALGGTYRFFDTTLNVNGRLQPNGRWYQTRMIGYETADMIAEYARSPRPFFLWSSYVAPHTGTPIEGDDPGQVTRADGSKGVVGTPARPRFVRGIFDDEIPEAAGAPGEADTSDKPWFVRDSPALTDEEFDAVRTLTRQRAESLAIVDREVEDTIEALDDAGVLENTIVVFTSDNGFFLGEHRQRQGKLLPYEDSLRTPTLVRGPEVPVAQTRADPLLTVDFLPTLREAAGLPAGPADGTSLWQVVTDGDRGWDRAVFTESGPIRNHPGVERPENLLDRPDGPSVLRSSQGVRTPHHLYVEHVSGERELYDLRTDPGQLESVAGDPARREEVAVLAGLLDRLRTCRGRSCEVPVPASLR